MDLVLVRSFLESATRGSFSEAADRLHVSQSTMSSRIKALEEILGVRLFQRGKTGAVLTAAGRHFHRHALRLVETWEHARQDVSLPERFRERLRIGSEAGLWLRLLVDWIAWMREAAPDVALRLDSGSPDALMTRMTEGLFDLVIMYTPDSRPGLALSRVGEEDLLLVASPDCETARDGSALPPGYIHVDWGREFEAAHRAHFPDFDEPGLVIAIGLLAHRLLLKGQASAYLPLSLVNDDLASGKLKEVQGAPRLQLPVYALSRSGEESPVIRLAIESLRDSLGRRLAGAG